MSTSNKLLVNKKSKLSHSKKVGGQGMVAVEPICDTAVLNETCDFKEPMVYKRDLYGADRFEIGKISDKESEFISTETHGAQSKERTSSDITEETVLCQVCSKNISHFNSERRLQHVNRCIDKLESEQIEEKKEVQKQARTIKSPILNCPMCGKAFKSAAARQTHLKKCAAINNISTDAMLKLVKTQEQNLGMKSNLTSTSQSSKPSKSDKAGPSRKRKIKEPKSQFDEDVQLAMAVSSSLADQNKTAAELLEENLQGITGQNKKRRRKNVLDDVCLLTTLSEEDKQRRIEQKLHTVLLEENIEDSEEEEEEDKNGLPALLESSLKASCLQSENKLWQRSKHHGNVSEIMEFYVNSLMPPIVPNKLPTASKMRRLSSIPGREKSFVADDLDRSAESTDHVDDVYTASTQTAVVLAELAVDGVNNDSMDLSKTADLSLHASGFCEEVLVQQAEELSKSRQETLMAFKQIINQPEFSDLTIKTSDGSTVYGHKSIIFTRCPKLRQLLDDINSSISLSLSRDSTLAFLTYIYTGELQCTASIQHELKEIAKRLELSGLNDICNTLTSNESSNEKVADEPKSKLEIIKLGPVVDIKDIWGESDSDVDDDDGLCDRKKGGTDTEFDTDIQEAICDEDYHDIMCTQKTHNSQELRLDPVGFKDDRSFPLTMSKGRASTQEELSNTISDQTDHNEHLTLSYLHPGIERKVHEENKSATDQPENYEDSHTSGLDESSKSFDSAHHSVLGNNSSFNAKQRHVIEDDLNHKITSCDKRIKESEIDIGTEGENDGTEEMISSSQVFDRSGGPRMDTSNIDLFQSPSSPDLALQSGSVNNSPSSPLFNKKRKRLFDNHVIELDLESEDEGQKGDKDIKTESQVSCDDWTEKMSVENRNSFSQQSGLKRDENSVDKFNDKNENKTNVSLHISPSKCIDGLPQPFTVIPHNDNNDIEITGDNLIEVKSKKEKKKEATFLGPQINFRLSQPSPHPVKKETEISSYDLDDTSSKINACDNVVKCPELLDDSYTYKDSYVKLLKDSEGHRKTESDDDIELMSVDSESNNSLHEEREDIDKNGEDVKSDTEQTVNSIVEDIADVWEDFDDCGIGFEDTLSPVRPQSSPEKGVILHKTSQYRDDTLVDIDNGKKQMCDDDDDDDDDDSDHGLANDDDLQDNDNSFVFHTYNHDEKERTEEQTFKTPTVNNSTKQKKTWVPPSPFTPMPDYDKMNTPALKKEVKKYGVKPVSKKRMVTVLKDIYEQTHQYETDSEFEDDGVSEKISTMQTTVSNNDRKYKGGTSVTQDPLPSSQESNTSDCMEESVLMAESTSDSDTQSSPQKGVDIKKKLHSFITSDQDLHMRVLMYEPLEVDVLKASLKEAGIKCSMDKLLEFLDETCIAFTSKNTRKRAQSKKRTKKASSKPG